MSLSTPQIRRPGLLGLLAAFLTVAAAVACLGLVTLASSMEARTAQNQRVAKAPRVLPVQKEADAARSPIKAHGG